MASLTIRNLQKSFGGFSAVSGFNVEVPDGKTLGLLGPSGCGKTTTLNMIAGLIRPNSGDILMGDKSVIDFPPYRRNIGMVFQSYALFPHMTVFENIAYGLKTRKLGSTEEIRAKVAAALASVRLSGMEERYPRQLSGGQQQRVALARAMVVNPSVLLLDEPLSNLDARLRDDMRHEIRQIITSHGLTTVFVTHDQEEAFALSDIVAVMNAGKVEQIGEGVALYNRPASRFVAKFLGDCNLVSGKIVKADKTVATIALEGGQTVDGLNDTSLAKNDAAFLAIRPEKITISTVPAPADVSCGAATIQGRVAAAAFSGPVVDYTIAAAKADFRVKVINAGGMLEVGREVSVTLRRDDCLMIRP